MPRAGITGVSKNTPEKILFGAGTIHKNLKYDTSKNTWNFDESIWGATSGGSSLSIEPEFTDIEADGATVLVKGLKVKTSEKAEMEVNFLELSKEIITASVIGKLAESADTLYDLIESKADIEEGDYLDNIAFVGKTLKGKNIIAILDNALCTSGFKSKGENKKESVGTYTFACHADINGELNKLPYHIYYPKAEEQKLSQK